MNLDIGSTKMKNILKARYEHHVLPHVIEHFASAGPMMHTRSQLVPQAEGRVLEIGIGTGLNLSFYDPVRVTSITGVDPSAAMNTRAQARARQISIPVETVALTLGQICAESHSFDTIVCTFTLCSIPDALGTLKEMRRLLRPGGRYLFAEHGRAPDASTAFWQDKLEPFWTPLAGGCRLSVDIPPLIRHGGFAIQDMATYYLPGWRPMNYVYRGWAN